MNWFEPRRLGEMAPASRVLVYGLLALWTFVVLFPLYWVLITSFKLPVQVGDGPDYMPFVDYRPSLHAWRYIVIDLGGDTFRPYLNSVIVASISTVLAMVRAGRPRPMHWRDCIFNPVSSRFCCFCW